MDNHAEFEVQDADGVVLASASGPRAAAIGEALHYALLYGRDGPVSVFEVVRTRWALADLRDESA